MLRSLISGFSGLKTHVTGMDVVGNNIANVNTIGFKEGRATFQDVLSQTLSSANSSTSSLTGGKNAIQVGLGTALATVDNVFSQGGLDATGNQNDLAINGEGFFAVRSGDQVFHTRAGNFSFDANGNYVNPNGYFVQGWTTSDPATGTIRASGPLSNVVLPRGLAIPANPTSLVEISANINSEVPNGNVQSVPMEIYDSLGSSSTILLVLTKSATNTWDWSVSASSGTVSGSGTITFDSLGRIQSGGNVQFSYDPVSGAASGQVVDVDIIGGTVTNNAGLTQTTAQISIGLSSIAQDGFPAGDLQSFLVDFNGTIRAFFDNGQSQEIAKIAITTFANQNGLKKIGDNLYAATANSGDGVVGESGTGSRGKIQPSTLEFSNVDLAAQFTRMIILQRGFQANARMVTTSDEMLQSLLSLKR